MLQTILGKAHLMEPFISEKQILELPLGGILGTDALGGKFTTEYWIMLSYR